MTNKTNENGKCSLEEIRKKARHFLKEKHTDNINTFKNYRTSINYFLYIMDCEKEIFDKINDDNKYEALSTFKRCLFKGFDYKVESANDVLGYTEDYLNESEKTFKPINNHVKIKGDGVNTHLRRIATFFNKKLHLKIKYREMEKCKVNKQKYKALTDDHVKLLIDECSNCWKKEEIATRNSLLIRLLFNNALRIREALELTIEDTNFIEYDEETNKAPLDPDIEITTIKIHEKGGDEDDKVELRISSDKPDMRKYIIDYINIKKVPSDYIFSTTRASTDGKAKPLSRQYFNKDMIKLAKYVDDNKNIDSKGRVIDKNGNETIIYDNISEIVENNSSHVFRHSKAKSLISKGVDIMTVKAFLRHSSLTSTQVYTKDNYAETNNLYVIYAI